MNPVETRFALVADNGDRLYPYKKNQKSTGRYGYVITAPGEQDRHGGGTYTDDISLVLKKMVFDGWSARVKTIDKVGPQRAGSLGISKRSIIGYEIDNTLFPLIQAATLQPIKIT